MRSVPSWLTTASILMLALILRIAGGIWWQGQLPSDQAFYFGDSLSYWDLAGDIAAGREYEYQQAKIFRTPGYPLILSPLFLVWKGAPPVIAARMWNACWGTAAVGLIMVLGRMQFDERTAYVSGLFAAILPEAIAGSVFVLSEAAFVPFVLIQLILNMRARQVGCQKRSAFFAFGGGIAGGLATLVRPSWMLFTIFQTVALSGCRLNECHADQCATTDDSCTPQRPSFALRRMILMTLPLVGLMLTLMPWWLRNYSLSGSFVPTTSEVGASLYDGWNPQADGSSNMDFKQTLTTQFEKSEAANTAASYPAAREVQLDQYVRQQALAWAGSHPARVLQLAGIKFVRMWNIWPNANDFRSLPGRLAIAATFGPLILLAVLASIQLLPQGPTSRWLLVLPAVYLTLLHVVFVSSLRYRLPALMPLLVLSAAGAGWLYDRWFVDKVST